MDLPHWYIFNKCIIARGDKCAEIKIREEITKMVSSLILSIYKK